MKNFFKKNWLIITIVILAALLRLWKLGSLPPGITQDEASLGYNAYSILKTGKDEYGQSLPTIFKSFGDYKPGFYVYLDVPFVATMGLNEVSTRLPSAIAGIFSVFLIYLISKNFFHGIENAAAFVAATNPWLIYYARGAWETNVVLTFTLAGIYLFLRSFKKSWLIIPSLSFFALTLLTYQGAKLSSFLVLFSLVVIYFKSFFKINLKYLVGGSILALVIALPIILSFFNGQAGRLKVFSIFSYPRPPDYTQAFLDEGGEKFGSASYYLFHSETLNFIRGIMGRYSNYVSGKFLFFDGDYQNPQHSPPYQGMLLISDFGILAIGLFALFSLKTIDVKFRNFIFLWLILSPLPGALSRDQVNAVRALNMAAPLSFILGLGLVTVLNWLKNKKSKTISLIILSSIYFVSITYFLDAYFVHVPLHNSANWNYGYKEAVLYITIIQGNYDKIKFQQSYSQPYIYFLYYQKYDPAKYQSQAKLIGGANSADIGFVTRLDNIEFANVNWASDKNDHGTLLVGDAVSLPEDTGLVHEIKYPGDRGVAFKMIEVK